MFTSDQLNQVSTLISESQRFILIFPKNSNHDVQAAASGLAQSIQALENKEVSTVTPSKDGFDQDLFGNLEVKNELGNKILQISFPYLAEKVDKVSYNIDDENQRFYLSIQPQKGEKPLDYHDLEYAYIGSDADLIILVGVGSFDSLEQLYLGYEDLYKDARIISLHTFDTPMGTIKLNAGGMSSLSEAVTMIARNISMPIPAEAATQLLSGIEQVTKSFSSFTANADTFESVGFLLRQGARRIKKAAPQLSTSPSPKVVEPKVEVPKKTIKSKISKEVPLKTEKKVTEEVIKPVGSLNYQPTDSSMGARG